MFDMTVFLARLVIPTAFALASLSAHAQDSADGRTLYTQNCESCHGSAATGTSRKATTPAALGNAISSVNQMKFLKNTLSVAEISNIAAYIASVNTAGLVTPAFDITAMWWVPAESGWGMSAIQSTSNKVFCVIYSYGADNKATWFVLPDITWTTPSSFNGTLYQTAGPVFNSVPFDPARVVATAVGTLTLNFSDANNASLRYTVNGVTVTKSITRQTF
jgi:cytochrome c553